MEFFCLNCYLEYIVICKYPSLYLNVVAVNPSMCACVGVLFKLIFACTYTSNSLILIYESQKVTLLYE